MEHVNWTEEGLRAAGFRGFVGLLDISADVIPKEAGVYVVVRSADAPPEFLSDSPAGRFKDKDPTVGRSALRTAWVDGALVLYIGKAGAGRTGSRGLRRRLMEYRRHGQGEPVGHRGGRYIWQLVDHAELLVAWRIAQVEENPELLESALIAQFVTAYGARPFANRKLGARTATA